MLPISVSQDTKHEAAPQKFLFYGPRLRICNKTICPMFENVSNYLKVIIFIK